MNVWCVVESRIVKRFMKEELTDIDSESISAVSVSTF